MVLFARLLYHYGAPEFAAFRPEFLDHALVEYRYTMAEVCRHLADTSEPLLPIFAPIQDGIPDFFARGG